MTTKKLSPRFVFKISESREIEIYMSFGLSNTLARYFETIDQLEFIALDADVRQSIIIDCLSERNENGRITKEFNLYELQALDDHIEEFFSWVGDHLTDFFIRMLRTETQRLKKMATTP